MLLPLYSNLILPSEYGIYSLLLSAYSIVAIFYQGGLSSGFSKYYVEEEVFRKSDFISAFMSFILGLGILCALIISIFSLKISLWLLDAPYYSGLITLVGWMLLTDSLIFSIIHILRTQEESKPAVFYSLLYSMLNLICNIYFVYYLRWGIEGIFYSSLAAGIICLIFNIPQLLKWMKGKIYISDLKKMWIFSLPLIIAGILSTLVDVFDRFLLNMFYDKAAVGLYSFGYRFALIMNIFNFSFRSAWTPFSIRTVKEGKQERLFGGVFLQIAALSSLIILMVILFIDDLFLLEIGNLRLINKTYEGSLSIIPLILLGYGINWVASFYSVYPYVSGKSGYFLASDFIGFLMNLSLNLLLIPVFHLQGAAAATLLSFISSSLFLYLISRKKISIIYPRKKIIYTLLSFIICGAIGYYFKNIIMDISILILYSLFLLKLGELNIYAINNIFRSS